MARRSSCTASSAAGSRRGARSHDLSQRTNQFASASCCMCPILHRWRRVVTSRMIIGGGITVGPEITFKVFVVFADAIYVRGQPEVREAGSVVRVAHARTRRKLRTADTLLLDYKLSGAAEFANELTSRSHARPLLCARSPLDDELAHAAETAAGPLPAGTLALGVVAVAVGVVSTGVGVLGLDLHTEARSGPAGPGRLARPLALDRASHPRRARGAGARRRGRGELRGRGAARLQRAHPQERFPRRPHQARRTQPLARGGTRGAGRDHLR